MEVGSGSVVVVSLILLLVVGTGLVLVTGEVVVREEVVDVDDIVLAVDWMFVAVDSGASIHLE